ncbi:MAG: isoaspartyl peptidase/L-asparaginase, partial [Raineya sp.]|nr:isoaspartyl peptidase/L-asparaginase [Raineya sp.]
MKIIIHGGFFSEFSQTEAIKKAKQEALRKIILQSYEYLKVHSALETAVFATKLLEDEPLFNAGLGSQIQSDGKIRMSASLMDGTTKKFAGVINIENIQNPILVAERLLAFDDRV